MRTLLPLLMIASLSVGVGCKKKPPTDMTANAPKVENTGNTGKVSDADMDAMRENFKRINFEFDQADLDAPSKAALKTNAEIMQRNPGLVIEVQGHADERGTTDYNLALGQRRAEAVNRYLTSLGVVQARVRTISFGEERPLTGGENESVWAQNRRAEFRILSGGDGGVQGTTTR